MLRVVYAIVRLSSVLGLICVWQIHVWPGLSVKDIDEINTFMQVSSKTSMSNAIFHNLESGSNELQSGFSENQLKLIEKADTM